MGGIHAETSLNLAQHYVQESRTPVRTASLVSPCEKLKLLLALSTDVERFEHGCDRVVFVIQYRQFVFRSIRGAVRRRLANFVELFHSEAHRCPDDPPSRLVKMDRCRLIPNHVLAAEQLHEKQHRVGVDHREQTAAKVRTDGVLVVPAEFHRDAEFSPFWVDMGNADPRQQIRWIKIEAKL